MPTAQRPSGGLPSPSTARKGDLLGFFVLSALVVLGAIAAAVSFMRM